MAGHSKWANIQHRKNAQDAKRGKMFTKLIREITTAARISGGDADTNPRLRLAIDKAFAQNMPKDTIERARKKGAGDLDGAMMEEVRYEGYGPNGVAVIVDCLTDNRNRTVAEVRHAFAKCGGNLGTDGSVAYLFQQRGIFSFAPGSDENKIMEVSLDAGAEDVVANTDQSIDVYTTTADFLTVKTALEKMHLNPGDAEVTWVAATRVNLDRENAERMLKLQDMLEDLDDVQNVYSNADLPDEML